MDRVAHRAGTRREHHPPAQGHGQRLRRARPRLGARRHAGHRRLDGRAPCMAAGDARRGPGVGPIPVPLGAHHGPRPRRPEPRPAAHPGAPHPPPRLPRRAARRSPRPGRAPRTVHDRAVRPHGPAPGRGRRHPLRRHRPRRPGAPRPRQGRPGPPRPRPPGPRAAARRRPRLGVPRPVRRSPVRQPRRRPHQRRPRPRVDGARAAPPRR